jgi:hypothetical protein
LDLPFAKEADDANTPYRFHPALFDDVRHAGRRFFQPVGDLANRETQLLGHAVLLNKNSCRSTEFAARMACKLHGWRAK